MAFAKSTKKILAKNNPQKGLTVHLKQCAGRAKSGRITVRHRGGGVKKLYRIIEFGQRKIGEKAKVLSLEYDPYRTAFISLIEYEDGKKRYILASHETRVGDTIIFSENAPIEDGSRLPLKSIPIGTFVYNIELSPGKGGQIARAAGARAKVLAREGKYAHLKMPSNEIRKILLECFASIGIVSHKEHRFEVIGKAGSNRLRGKRPSVRGSAMNPVDHPHGGGEGRAPIGLKYPKTPWGKPALGVRTKRRKWTHKYIIKRRFKKK